MSVDDELNESTRELTPGGMLAEARERANLSHEVVANTLHMTVTKVKAIEADEFSKLNVDTYIRGYLRSYAALVKIDSVEVIAAYEKIAGKHGLQSSCQECLPKGPAPRKEWKFFAVIAGVLLLLLLISVWFFGNRINTSTNLAPAPILTPAAPISKPAAPVIMNDKEPAAEQSEAASSDLTLVDDDTDSEVTHEYPEDTPLDQLYLVFSDECWLEVSDAQGDVLATDNQRPNSRLSLMGKAPFKVKLGKVSSATITLNGEPVALSAPSGVDVHTFTIGQAAH